MNILLKRLCTAKNPYTADRNAKEPGYGWEHDNVIEIGDQENGYPGGDIITNKCLNCGVTWREELPQ